MNKSIPFEEQETVVILQPACVSQTAEVYTCMPNMLKKIRKLAESRPEEVKIKQDKGDMLIADVDRAYIKISPKRHMSEESKKAASERLARLRGEVHDPG